MSGFSSVNEMLGSGEYDDSDDSYRYWFERLPRYHVEGNTIFVHAGIDEDSGNAWEYCTEDYILQSSILTGLARYTDLIKGGGRACPYQHDFRRSQI